MPTTTTVDDIATMPMPALSAMPRERVERLSAAARQARSERLLADDTVVTRGDIADMFRVSLAAVARWRFNSLRTGAPGPNALPAPPPEINSADVARPGPLNPNGRRPRGSEPRWYASLVRKWGQQTGRLDEDLFPRKGGRKPPGRPRRSGAVPAQRTEPPA